MDRRKRILIVDDEPNVRLVFRTALATLGADIALAEDGGGALDLLEQSSFDLVMLDVRMPHVDGMEALRRLRERGDDTPVVIVTAHGDVPHAVEAMKLGAINFLSKPLAPAALQRAAAEVLAQHTTPVPAPKPPGNRAIGGRRRDGRASGRRPDGREAGSEPPRLRPPATCSAGPWSSSRGRPRH